MLGWEIFISRNEVHIANWMTRLNGLDWLEELVEAKQAIDHGGNGYPLRYSITAGVLLGILKGGIPRASGPLVLGDDYVQPSGWIGRNKVELAKLEECAPGEQLEIEAWDQS